MALSSDYHMYTPQLPDFSPLKRLNLSTIVRRKPDFPQAKRELDEILAAHPQLR